MELVEINIGKTSLGNNHYYSHLIEEIKIIIENNDVLSEEIEHIRWGVTTDSDIKVTYYDKLGNKLAELFNVGEFFDLIKN